MHTLLVIAEDLLWGRDTESCPGDLLPTAKQTLDAARAAAPRVVIASYCANTHLGAQRCRRLIESLGFTLSNTFDLHTAAGFPIFDKVWSEPGDVTGDVTKK